jgi:hypothetical protein
MISVELNFILLILAFILLGIASIEDFKSREVTEWIWLSMIAGGIIIHVLQLILQIIWKEPINDYLITWILNIILSFGLAVFILYTGLMGEADGIALVAIAVITPFSQPFITIADPQYDIVAKILPRILGTFFNAHLFAISAPLIIFVYNLINQRMNPEFYSLPNESLWTRFVIRFIGYPHPTGNLSAEIEKKPWHYDFLEDFKDESEWKIAFRVWLDTPEADLQRKKDLISIVEKEQKKSIWIQPTSPGIFYLMLGYLADLIFGNIIIILMALII